MVSFKERSSVTKFPGILILTIVSTIWISSQVSIVHGTPTITTPLVVKITYPHKGQQVGIGHNVTLLGTSSYNATNKCQVSIIVDNKRPYQSTIPIGQGEDNYSQWKYTLAPTYAAVTEGMNRVTAKLTCNANPALTKFYSINLTGTNQAPSTSQQQIAIKSNDTISPFFLPPSLPLSSAMSNSTLASSHSTSTPSVLPFSVSNSSLIDPSSTHSGSSSSSGHSHKHHHSHHTHHSSSDSGSSGSDHHSSSGSDHHSFSSSDSRAENHDNENGESQ